MTYRKSLRGARVRVTIEGVVIFSDGVTTRFADGRYVVWPDGDGARQVEVLDPGFHVGDVASYTDHRGDRKTLFFMDNPGESRGWYDAFGVEIDFPEGEFPALIARWDGALVDQSPSEPEASPRSSYVPRAGDVALCRIDGVMHTVFYAGGTSGSSTWFDESGRVRLIQPGFVDFTLVVSGNELVEEES
jgi:hypothetical protein